MEPHIYHMAPSSIQGENLLPLFQLKEEHPETYLKAIVKYQDHPKRKELPFRIIPKFNCRRGDVLHCSPIHPNLVYQALRRVFPDFDQQINFYAIPVKNIVKAKLIFFDVNHPGYRFGLDEDPIQVFSEINNSVFKEMSQIPDQAIESYRDFKHRGFSSAPAWAAIPHVFVQGSINVSNLKIIDWQDDNLG